jgi:D-3-phosphoglycerate dehydrogenase / 2-oxoglutarate reductase
VICLPHLGASTLEAEENCAIMIVKQVREFLENGTITYSVNFPSIEMPVNAGAVRLAIANQNIPNMVAQISAKLADAKLNIVSLLNKSREEIAFTLIDVNGEVSPVLFNELSTIKGVVQVRVIQPKI